MGTGTEQQVEDFDLPQAIPEHPHEYIEEETAIVEFSWTSIKIEGAEWFVFLVFPVVLVLGYYLKKRIDFKFKKQEAELGSDNPPE